MEKKFFVFSRLALILVCATHEQKILRQLSVNIGGASEMLK